jgi:hydroxymethylbilane synthase
LYAYDLKRPLRVGTRRSALAKAQTQAVINQLLQLQPQLQIQIIEIVTTGDKVLDTALSRMSGKGVFVKEIEDNLLENEIDIAVHSMKDLPTAFPAGLKIGAITERVDPRDVFVTRFKRNLEEMPAGARIGTSSLRRKAQLLALRPDFQVIDIRGNIDTRLRKAETSEYDGIVLAAAGLTRMGWQDRIQQYLNYDVMIPAVGQGAVGVEIRDDDHATASLLKPLNHKFTETAVNAERKFLAAMGGGCQTPMGAFCEIDGGQMIFHAFVAKEDGSHFRKGKVAGKIEEAAAIAEKAALRLKETSL